MEAQPADAACNGKHWQPFHRENVENKHRNIFNGQIKQSECLQLLCFANSHLKRPGNIETSREWIFTIHILVRSWWFGRNEWQKYIESIDIISEPFDELKLVEGRASILNLGLKSYLKSH